jgi:WD40 repeat protein
LQDAPSKKDQDEPQPIWVLETGDSIMGLEIATNGSTVAVATQSNRVALVGNDGEIKWNREFDRPVIGVDLSSLGNTVVVGLRTGEIYCLDEDGEEMWSYNIHARLEAIHISKSGRYIVVGSRDTYTYFFDSTGLLLWRSKADGRIREVATSTSANYVVSGSSNKDIFLHDNYSSNMRGAVTWRHELGGDITSLAISSDGHFIAVGATDNMFDYFDKVGKLHWKHHVENQINAIALAPRGDFVAIGVEGGTYPGQVCLYSQKQGLIWRYLTGSGGVRDVDITTNGRYVVAGTGDGMVSLFHQTEKLIWKKKLESAVAKVRVSARGRLLVAATDEGHLHMFNTTDFLLKRQSAHTGLDEQAEIVFTKPQKAVRTRPVGVPEDSEEPGPVTMGRQTMVYQKPKRAVRSDAGEQRGMTEGVITRPALLVINAMLLVFIGFLSFVPLGESGEYMIEPVVGVLLMIFLMLIMIATWVTKE